MDLLPSAFSASFAIRDVGFSWTHYLRFFSETSGIDVTLLGSYNDIRHPSNSNWIMPN